MIALAVGAIMVVCLALYALTAGADFGGGIWDLFATGPRRERQREVIARALAPIWEANHVWLIVVIVLFFVAFPGPFARFSIALHVPLVVMLVGIVLRGCAFVFRAYGGKQGAEERWFGRIFAVSSLLTPFMLGATLGAASNAEARWWALYPILVGVLVVVTFAFLAAVYLTHETQDPRLRGDFRLRALIAGAALPVVAWVALIAARSDEARIWEQLTATTWALPFHGVVAAVGAAALVALIRWRFDAARVAAIALVVLIVAGWALAQYPYVIGETTIDQAAAPDAVLIPILIVLAAGGLLVLPGFVYLYKVFKAPP